MFGHHYFGAGYFGPRYFGPSVTVGAAVPPVVIGGGGPDEDTADEDAWLKTWLTRNKQETPDVEALAKREPPTEEPEQPLVEVQTPRPVKPLPSIADLVEHSAKTHVQIAKIAADAAREKRTDRIEALAAEQLRIEQEEFDDVVAVMMTIAALDDD